MVVIAVVLVALVALEHVYILVLEMFLWTKPAGLRAFGQTKEQAEAGKVLAANQGLYNGFLAAGLIWGLLHPEATTGFQIKAFFLICILLAGLYGGYSVKPKIILVQAVPALLALAALWFS
ncbi:DUF1304 domain-containing protein [Bradyrhizobium sp. WD16]|uniref:DUF1304 domain-containing protein n=1 Tax=Bradyrhizobium sp. WD16 TaxID=1521768 RepID=UPI0020A59F79|nr:DUF1304 domain-containing protein [Bradyrhizobium sp. WD16]UTD27202.1 DUF1304 domain-containing protein [Bradyrhizobium sp. WD16]